MQTKRTAIDWFVAISTSLLVFIFLLSFALGPAVLWRWSGPTVDVLAAYLIVAIFIASCAAGRVWFLSRRIQFHAFFWPGLTLLVGSLLLVLYTIHISRTEHRSGALETAVSLIVLTIMCAQVLLTTALFLDRPTPPHR